MLFKLFVFFLLSCNAFGSSLRNGKPFFDIESADSLFADFIQAFNKLYETESEYNRRFKIFVKNLETINDLNEKHELTTFGINPFTDMTSEERSMMNGFRPDSSKPKLVLNTLRTFEGDIPESVDWRKNNSVTAVRDQGYCGSCWAFSAIAIIESQYAIKHKKQVDLSEEQLVDCDYDDNSCKGGLPINALEYAAEAGVMLEADYPYSGGFDDYCTLYDPKKVVVTVNNATEYNTTEDVMAKLVATYGPISIGIYSSDEIHHYKSGVLSPTDCKPGLPSNHALAIVGYGTDNGTPYWLIKNSLGTGYGEKGYLRLLRGKAVCNIVENVAIVNIE